MKKLSDSIADLSKLAAGARIGSIDRLRDLESFGDDPGNLRARIHVPDSVADQPALVVVLHGCTQTAAGYNHGSGWSQLADEQGFVLLFAEQRRANNPNLCFNWFQPGDYSRDSGEALSIRQMIDTMIDQYDVDPARIFVTGLSAGGAMTSVMLATYPELFAGGAIMAGLPYGTASNVSQALERMRGHGMPAPAELGALVRQASSYRGPWPAISIWHGTADATVKPSNADAIVDQWRVLHGVDGTPGTVEIVDGYPHRIWRDAARRAVIEEYSITGMSHGTPLDTVGEHACGTAGPFMLETGISSTRRVAAFWGLSGVRQAEPARSPDAMAAAATAPASRLPVPRTAKLSRMAEPPKSAAPAQGVGKIIEDALRAAGLMR
ncbi:alpha/beta hydrolase family esterase [Sphingomonas sp. MMS24-J13]|uniref:extracellular catalytic domain type 1 short-chain-length polyhydroxyalkanoate depolymerase n=1 Tax=Sphingomonas sp. MMS24-J13 TaxID=3238686 RepID=UPI00384E0395